MGCCGGRKLPEQGRQLPGQSAGAASQGHGLPNAARLTARTGSGAGELVRQPPQRSVRTPGLERRSAVRNRRSVR